MKCPGAQTNSIAVLRRHRDNSQGGRRHDVVIDVSLLLDVIAIPPTTPMHLLTFIQ
jgi:hypothetical protein